MADVVQRAERSLFVSRGFFGGDAGALRLAP